MQRIFIWGTGYIAEQVLEQCRIYEEFEILGFIDNKYKGNDIYFKGKRIFKPSILDKTRPDKIVILTDYYDEIRQQITNTWPDMECLIENKNYFFKQCMIRRYENVYDPEIISILEYIKTKDLQMFNYEFVDKYKHLKIDVYYNSDCQLFYVYHQNKRLYFAKFLDNEIKVKEYYRCLLIEQDSESPHRYLSSSFNIEENSVVVDVGAAEGMFSLEIVEKISKIYIIEAENEWVKALQETFKYYQEKVVIIQKFITSMKEGKAEILDNLIKEPVDFIKMDIEGNEWDALLGAKNLITQSLAVKCAICSYHSDFDEILIKSILEDYGIRCSTTMGYVWFPVKLRKSYISLKLCRGVVRGIK